MLYWLLFLPGVSLPDASPGTFPFDSMNEISRTVLRDLPALALVWYLARRSLPSSLFNRPKRADVLVAAALFGSLVIVSSATGITASFFEGPDKEAFLEAPRGPLAWLVAAASCAATGYLEESYFRAYLITKAELLGIPLPKIIAISVTLFSLCHLYEGPWGTINAVAAGTILSLAFARYRSVHPLAWAHAAYNAFAYSGGA